jgi:hypothetical protein
VYEIAGEASQLSVAVADPVLAGNCEAWQLIVIFAGHVITGAVLSIMVIICVNTFATELEQASLTVQVFVYVPACEQLPATKAPLVFTGVRLEVQLSVAAGSSN